MATFLTRETDFKQALKYDDPGGKNKDRRSSYRRNINNEAVYNKPNMSLNKLDINCEMKDSVNQSRQRRKLPSVPNSDYDNVNKPNRLSSVIEEKPVIDSFEAGNTIEKTNKVYHSENNNTIDIKGMNHLMSKKEREQASNTDLNQNIDLVSTTRNQQSFEPVDSERAVKCEGNISPNVSATTLSSRRARCLTEHTLANSACISGFKVDSNSRNYSTMGNRFSEHKQKERKVSVTKFNKHREEIELNLDNKVVNYEERREAAKTETINGLKLSRDKNPRETCGSSSVRETQAKPNGALVNTNYVSVNLNACSNSDVSGFSNTSEHGDSSHGLNQGSIYASSTNSVSFNPEEICSTNVSCKDSVYSTSLSVSNNSLEIPTLVGAQDSIELTKTESKVFDKSSVVNCDQLSDKQITENENIYTAKELNNVKHSGSINSQLTNDCARSTSVLPEVSADTISKSSTFPSAVENSGISNNKCVISDDLHHSTETQVQSKHNDIQSGLRTHSTNISDGINVSKDHLDYDVNETFQAPQMRRSTTSDAISSHRNSNKKLSSGSFSQNYFSLERRKRPRINTLQDSKGNSVSLEMLLKSRQKFRRSNTIAESEKEHISKDTISVEDILQSCREYDARPAYYRNRATSDVIGRSPRFGFPFLRETNESILQNDGMQPDLQLVNPPSRCEVVKASLNLNTDARQVCDTKQDACRRDRQSELKDVGKLQGGNINTEIKIGDSFSQATNSNIDDDYSDISPDYATIPLQNLEAKPVVSEPRVVKSCSYDSSDYAKVNKSKKKSKSSDSQVNYTTFTKGESNNNQESSSSGVSDLISRQSSSMSDSFSPVFSEPKTPEKTPQELKQRPKMLDRNGSVAFGSARLTNESDIQSPTSVSSGTWSEKSGHLTLLSVDTTSITTSGSSSPANKSPRQSGKVETSEALTWLRVTGFPQYAQMFDDGQFPIDLMVVEKDHDFLDKDSMQSLFRRLETLNKHAGMKIDTHSRKKQATSEDDDDEDLCALSERWEYQKTARRWSRKDIHESPRGRSGSHDSLLTDQESPQLDTKMPHTDQVCSLKKEKDQRIMADRQLSVDVSHEKQDSPISPRLRRVASERIKSAKNLWKKMEGGLKGSKKSRRRNILEISGPVISDDKQMQEKLKRLNCVEISPTSETLPSFSRADSKSLSPSSCSSPSVSRLSPAPSETSAQHKSNVVKEDPKTIPHSVSTGENISTQINVTNSDNLNKPNKLPPVQENLSKSFDTSVSHSKTFPDSNDSSLSEFYLAQDQFRRTLESTSSFRKHRNNAKDTSLREIFLVPQDHQPGSFPKLLQNGYIDTDTDVRKSILKTSDKPQNEILVNSNSNQLNGNQRGSVYDNYSDSHNVLHKDLNRDTLRNIREASVESSSSDTSFTKLSLESSSVTDFSSSSTRRTSRSSGSSNISGHSLRHGTTKSVPQSTSLDSYLKNLSLQETGSSTTSSSTSTLQQKDEELDLVLKQLYSDIEELGRAIGEELPDFQANQELRVDTSLNSTLTTSQSGASTPAASNLTSDIDDSLDLSSPSIASPEEFDSGGVELDRLTDTVNSSDDSNTAESTSDHETANDSLDQIQPVSRERRDSGVGHSLTRAPSDRRRKKIRWHSFQRSHRPEVSSRAQQISSLTVSQLVRLQKLSYLKLTGIMEKSLPVSKSGWTWMVPRFMKRNKSPDFSDKNVFGVPLSVMAQRTGQPLPQCILYAMRYLRRTAHASTGIFRKSGVKSKIQQLRDQLEAHPETTDFEDANSYNVADLLKTYFRDLPECLLTNKLSETFRSIYTYVPQSQRLDAMQAAVLLLPDENREVLQSLLLFLWDIAKQETEHQMNASNLAVCFTPTVFQLGPRSQSSYSPKRNRRNMTGEPDPREIQDQKAAHACLLMMISECKNIFTVPPGLFRQLQVQSLAMTDSGHELHDLCGEEGSTASEKVRAFGQERVMMILKEAHDKSKAWVSSVSANNLEVYHRKPLDDSPLKEWKLVVYIEAPPVEVLRRVMHERHHWDEDLLSWCVVERLDPHSDIYQYVLNSMAPHPTRHLCVLRYWRSDLSKGACALVTISVEHSDVQEVQGVRAIDMGSYFHMEPCGSGKCRLTHITRVDTRGRCPEWYSRIYGHVTANFVERLRDSFKHDARGGPETKV